MPLLFICGMSDPVKRELAAYYVIGGRYTLPSADPKIPLLKGKNFMCENKTSEKDGKTVKIAVIGGDMRQLEAAADLSSSGYEVSVFGLDIAGQNRADIEIGCNLSDTVMGAQLVLLPLPYTRDYVNITAPLATSKISLGALRALMSKNQLIAAGMVSEPFAENADFSDFEIFDYAGSESFEIKNAAATVEGALAVAIKETKFTVNGSKVLVIGYGRIGKLLSGALASLGAQVCVTARKNTDIAWAWACGREAVKYSELTEKAAQADIIFNTVPAPVVSRQVFERMKKGTVCIELASLPGGFDLRAAQENGIDVIMAQGLPGKYSPVTAGRIIADSVREILSLNAEDCKQTSKEEKRDE